MLAASATSLVTTAATSAHQAVLKDILQLRHAILKKNLPEEKGLQLIKSPKYPGVEFIRHQVKPSDDLTVLAIRYGTTESEIRRFNRRVVFDSLENVMFDFLLIPVDGNEVRKGNTFPDQRPEEQVKIDQQVDEKYMKTRCFLLHSGPGTKYPQATKWEASFYLEETGYNLDQSLDQWKSDVEWEATHPYVPSETKKEVPALTSTTTPIPQQLPSSSFFLCFQPSHPHQSSITTDSDILSYPNPRKNLFTTLWTRKSKYQYHTLEMAPISYV